MNPIFRVVWNHEKRVMQVVSELAKNTLTQLSSRRSVEPQYLINKGIGFVAKFSLITILILSSSLSWSKGENGGARGEAGFATGSISYWSGAGGQDGEGGTTVVITGGGDEILASGTTLSG